MTDVTQKEPSKTIIFGSEGWGHGAFSNVIQPLIESELPGKEFLVDRSDKGTPEHKHHDFMIASFFHSMEPFWNTSPKKYIFYNGEPYDHNDLTDQNLVHCLCGKGPTIPDKSPVFFISARCDIPHDIHIPYFLYVPYKYMPRINTRPIKERPYFLAYCASNCVNHTSFGGLFNCIHKRDEMYDLLVARSQDRPCHAFGKKCGSHPETKIDGSAMPASWEMHFPSIYKDYRFALVFENSRYHGYVTEKLLAALVAGCIPIYLGAPNVGDYFNKKAFIDVGDFPSLEACAEYATNLSDEQIDSMLREPYMNETSEVANLYNDNYNASHYNSTLADYKRKLKMFMV